MKTLTKMIMIFSDGSTITHDIGTIAPTEPIEPVTPTVAAKPKHTRRSLRPHHECYHNGTYYPSINNAELITGLNRYWIQQYANKQQNGWSWK